MSNLGEWHLGEWHLGGWHSYYLVQHCQIQEDNNKGERESENQHENGLDALTPSESDCVCVCVRNGVRNRVSERCRAKKRVRRRLGAHGLI